MDAVEVDHYAVLGLASGEEGAKLSDREIREAYRTKVLRVHPDKSQGHDELYSFEDVHTSYKVLKDEQARKSFDDRLRIERERERKKKRKVVRQPDCKKTDLQAAEERYHIGFGVYLSREEEERYSRKLNEEIERVIALHTKQKQAWSSMQKEYATDHPGVNYNVAAATQPSSSKHNDGLEKRVRKDDNKGSFGA